MFSQGISWASWQVVTVGLGMILLIAGLNRPILWATGVILLSVVLTLIVFSPIRYQFVYSVFLVTPHLLISIALLFQRRDTNHISLTHISVLFLIIGGAATLLRQHPTLLTGPEWGSRYLLNFFPVASIIVTIYLWDRFTKKQENYQLYLAGSLLLAMISVLFVGRGIKDFSQTKQDLQLFRQAIEQQDEPLVTDIFWLQGALAPAFIEREAYILEPNESLTDWLDTADLTHLEQFTYVTFEPIPQLPQNDQYNLTITAVNQSLNLLMIEVTISDTD